ncbi:PIN domain-like protein [Nadsonia fulvescens var. elongata DSM 6958]|uniref:PIN domain-like protein n=1 Tax=Nadsonia fulvescens var. elongata DSM 6958 TaxID=857566 RepID=A0A1E3PIZ2_9ASCO|nr:PIN domain-like protein [Nadsonia fulvescens var. elongata DSM 6958]
MGIQGLLPLLKSIQKSASVSQFEGKSVAVDGYAWLHKGAINCAMELALDKPTVKYIDYVIRRVQMLRFHNVEPYIVLDGDYLPSKEKTETQRSQSRAASREAALKLFRAGNEREARAYFQKCIDITPEMVRCLIEALRQENVRYVVAPYEADSQLIYMEKIGRVAAIISEDSDLLIFGVNTLLTKMDDQGNCLSISRSDFASCTEIDLADFSDVQLRAMAIFSGCDYTDGIPKIGLKTAHKFLRKYRTPERALKAMRMEHFAVPSDFEQIFRRADLTFQHQRVFCIETKKLIMLNKPVDDIDAETEVFLGADVPIEICQQVASGEIHPTTKLKIPLPTGFNYKSYEMSRSSRYIPARKSTSMIENYFTPKPVCLASPSKSLGTYKETVRVSKIPTIMPSMATTSPSNRKMIASFSINKTDRVSPFVAADLKLGPRSVHMPNITPSILNPSSNSVKLGGGTTRKRRFLNSDSESDIDEAHIESTPSRSSAFFSSSSSQSQSFPSSKSPSNSPQSPPLSSLQFKPGLAPNSNENCNRGNLTLRSDDSIDENEVYLSPSLSSARANTVSTTLSKIRQRFAYNENFDDTVVSPEKRRRDPVPIPVPVAMAERLPLTVRHLNRLNVVVGNSNYDENHKATTTASLSPEVKPRSFGLEKFAYHANR